MVCKMSIVYFVLFTARVLRLAFLFGYCTFLNSIWLNNFSLWIQKFQTTTYYLLFKICCMFYNAVYLHFSWCAIFVNTFVSMFNSTGTSFFGEFRSTRILWQMRIMRIKNNYLREILDDLKMIFETHHGIYLPAGQRWHTIYTLI